MSYTTGFSEPSWLRSRPEAEPSPQVLADWARHAEPKAKGLSDRISNILGFPVDCHVYCDGRCDVIIAYEAAQPDVYNALEHGEYVTRAGSGRDGGGWIEKTKAKALIADPEFRRRPLHEQVSLLVYAELSISRRYAGNIQVRVTGYGDREQGWFRNSVLYPTKPNVLPPIPSENCCQPISLSHRDDALNMGKAQEALLSGEAETLHLAGQLCFQCYKIYMTRIGPLHFPVLDNGSGRNRAIYGFQESIYVGAVQHIRPSTECRMCQFLFAMTQGDPDTYDYHLHALSGFGILFNLPFHETVDQFEDRMRAGREPLGAISFDGVLEDLESGRSGRYSSAHMAVVKSLRDKELSMFRPTASQDTPFFAVIPGAATPLDAAEILQTTRRPRFFVTADASPRLFPWLDISGSTIQDDSEVNFDVICSWIADCSTQSCTDHKGSDKASGKLSLIDCETESVVEAGYKRKYVALSYIWGAKIAAYQPVDRSRPYALPKDRPATINDAMRAALQLGFRYIWIDMYCISSDPRFRHGQIASMDLIYKHAALTILAVAGHDAEYGLPGMGARPRRGKQHSFGLGSHRFVEPQTGIDSFLQDSVYRTRGWTYQEEFFSSHRLIFTDHQAVYQCPRGTCFEGLATPTPVPLAEASKDVTLFNTLNDEFLKRTPADEFLRAGPWHVGARPKRSLIVKLFEHHVRQYTKRSLSMSSDSLAAVETILNRFTAESFPIHHLYGVPVLEDDSVSGAARFDIHRGLMWSHGSGKRALERRAGFPTWSWAGWEGPVRWLEDGLHGLYADTKNTSIFIADGSTTRPAGLWRNTPPGSSSPRQLIVQTKVFPVSVATKSRIVEDRARSSEWVPPPVVPKRKRFEWKTKTTLPSDYELFVPGGQSSAVHVTWPQKPDQTPHELNQIFGFPLGHKTYLLITFVSIGEDDLLHAQRVGITHCAKTWFYAKPRRNFKEMRFILE